MKEVSFRAPTAHSNASAAPFSYGSPPTSTTSSIPSHLSAAPTDLQDYLVPPAPTSSHRFKRFGTVLFSTPPYTDSELVTSSLPYASSLLAVSNRYGRLFILSSSTPPRLLVASTTAVLECVEADKREQAEELKEDSHRVADTAASPSVFVPVCIGDRSKHVWHLSLSADEQWLLVMDRDHGRLYHISQFREIEAEQLIQPQATFCASGYIDVQWSPHHPSIFFLLNSGGWVAIRQVAEAGCVLLAGTERQGDEHITAMCVSPFFPGELWLGNDDGSLHIAEVDVAAGRLTVIERYGALGPSVDVFPERQPALHFISQPSPSTLVLGYAQSRSNEFDSLDYLTDTDIERIAVCSLDLSTCAYSYLGDVLQDELRIQDCSAPYSARHRFTALTLPALDAAVLYSNRAGKTAILGPEPSKSDGVGGNSHSRRWVAYEMQRDTDRAIVPYSVSWKDSYALGMALDITNRLSTADSAVDSGAEQQKQGSELDSPMPLLLMLTSDARLHMYHLVCSEPSMAEASRRLMRDTVEAMPKYAHSDRRPQHIASEEPSASTTAAAAAPTAAVTFASFATAARQSTWVCCMCMLFNLVSATHCTACHCARPPRAAPTHNPTTRPPPSFASSATDQRLERVVSELLEIHQQIGTQLKETKRREAEAMRRIEQESKARFEVERQVRRLLDVEEGYRLERVVLVQQVNRMKKELLDQQTYQAKLTQLEESCRDQRSTVYLLQRALREKAGECEQLLDYQQQVRQAMRYKSAECQQLRHQLRDSNTLSALQKRYEEKLFGDESHADDAKEPVASLSLSHLRGAVMWHAEILTQLQLMIALEERKAGAEKWTCKVCFDRDINVLLLPCRHAVMCLPCAKKVTMCPVCRGTIQKKAKLMFG